VAVSLEDRQALLYGAMLTYWTKVVTKAGLDDDPR
jgi:hypothetical protein